ncbi:MAG: HD domain-containing protein [Lachnospiraceae bacterium]|nr:HD domain-containing protein [Lachnospiraceae bacterium]
MSALIQAGFTREFPEYLDPADKAHAVIEKAIRYAADAHHGAFRKGNHLPYIVHPMECMMLTAQMTDDEDVIAAAALHDVVEDTPKTLVDLEQEFGSRIAGLVAMESEDKREGMNKEDTWKIRKQENLKREESASTEAKMIMLADKVSNMRATYRDYLVSGPSIWEKFNMKDVGEQEWYYRSVAEVLSELSEHDLYREYVSILNTVFSGN